MTEPSKDNTISIDTAVYLRCNDLIDEARRVDHPLFVLLCVESKRVNVKPENVIEEKIIQGAQHVFMKTYHDGISMFMLALTGRMGLSQLKMNARQKRGEAEERNSVRMCR